MLAVWSHGDQDLAVRRRLAKWTLPVYMRDTIYNYFCVWEPQT